jgi:long-subunit fatty acid transport protein
MGETVFTFGGNYSNKLYLGATMGLKFIRFVSTSVYEETANNTADSLKNWTFGENVTTHGSGIDFKIGMIYKINDMFRFGVAVHTPTWFVMKDDYQNAMSSQFDAGFSESNESPFGHFDYDLSTPFSALGSIGVVFGKGGLISADYQYSDYGSTRFSAIGTSFSSVNSTIQKKYKEVHTVRLGGEIVVENVFFRGGVAMSTSPLENGFRAGSSDFAKKSISAGVGFKPGAFFLDFGYVYTLSDQFYQPYTLELIDVPGVKSRVVTNNIVITAGVKF